MLRRPSAPRCRRSRSTTRRTPTRPRPQWSGRSFVEGAPQIPLGGDIAAGAAGQPCWVEGTVTDTSLAMADTRLVEINVACSPGAPRSSWQCPGSMPPLGLTCPDHRVRGLADFGLATGRERSSERPRGRVAVTHDLAGDPYTARSLSGAPRTTLPRATRACWAEPGPPVRPRSTYGRRVLAAMMWCRCVQRDVGHLLDGGGQHAGVGRGGAADPDYRHDQPRGQPGPATGWRPGPPAPQRPQSSGSGPSRGGQSPERT